MTWCGRRTLCCGSPPRTSYLTLGYRLYTVSVSSYSFLCRPLRWTAPAGPRTPRRLGRKSTTSRKRHTPDVQGLPTTNTSLVYLSPLKVFGCRVVVAVPRRTSPGLPRSGPDSLSRVHPFLKSHWWIKTHVSTPRFLSRRRTSQRARVRLLRWESQKKVGIELRLDTSPDP